MKGNKRNKISAPIGQILKHHPIYSREALQVTIEDHKLISHNQDLESSYIFSD